ncbi:gamma-1-syntrophin isoform X1 [Prionailurus iriomotensis]
MTTSFAVPWHMDFRTACEETKTGICLLQDGNQEPFKVRLHLAKDILMIQEQDVICVSGEPFYSGERTVTIRRQTVGGFGLSIKGGAEHNIPVVISKISKEQRAELSGLLFIGDAILQINGINVRKCRHEEVICSGSSERWRRSEPDSVIFKKSARFPQTPTERRLRIGLHLNYHPNNTDTLSCSSWPTSPGLRWEKRWCDLRQNAFQVIAVDGVCSGIIQCLSAEDCIDWLQAIATNISNLTKHNIKKINRNFPVNQQIVYMGWCEAREQDPLQDRAYSPTFLALRGSCLYKFLAPPVTTWDWTRAEKTFSVYEIMCKILKGFHQDSDLLDQRKHCFTVQSESGEDLYFSVELDSDLAQWERAFQTATFLEVERIQCKTYACVLESHLMGLTIDFSTGFICFDGATKQRMKNIAFIAKQTQTFRETIHQVEAVLWRYKFSQLKGSSDDGKSKIKFLFQNPDTKQIEAKELEFSNLFAVLHCIHSFFAAKVACLDPLFLGNQAAASAAPSSATTSKAKYTT